MKQGYTKTIVMIMLLAAAALLSACGLETRAQAQETMEIPTVTPQTRVIAEGRLVPRASTWLGFERLGRAAEVLVAEGQKVAKGDVLVRLDGRVQMEAAVKAAELELLNAQQALDELNEKAGLATGQARIALAEAQQVALDAHQALEEIDTQETQDQIDDAWVAAQDARTELEDAQEEFDKYKDLDQDNAKHKDTKAALDDAQKSYDEALREYERLKNELEQGRANAAQADAALADAQRQYTERQDGPAARDLELAQTRLENAQAQRSAAQAALADLELVAPFDGLVTQLEITAGEQLSPGQPVVQLADFSEWVVETTDLTEIDIVKIDPSQAVIVIPDALKDLELNGQIEHISDGFIERGGDVLYTVRITLDEADPNLRWGMTVEVQFARK